MLPYTLRRLAGLVPLLAAVVLIVFFAARAMPGDPIAMMLSDHSADLVLAGRLRAEYGLDRPLPVQLWHYLVGLVQGDLGLSFRYVHVRVSEVLAQGAQVSLALASGALLVALPLGIASGIAAALRRGRWQDDLLMAAASAAMSVPNFALSAFLVYLLSVRWGVLPVAGWGTPAQAVLPIVVLALPAAAYLSRLTRTFMLEVLRADYIRTAKAKGLPPRQIVLGHALVNTLVPLTTSAGIIFGGLLSATFVVETIFNIPGLGRLAIDSIFARDYPVMTAIILLFTIFYALINVVVDLLYVAIDPRIRVGGTR